MNIAIVGSRGFTERHVIQSSIRRWMVMFAEGITIVSGGAAGADSIGADIAHELNIPTNIFLPNWNLYGKSAGYKRNRLIVENADIVLAFFAPGPRSKGTQHSVDIAIEMGKPLYIYHEGVWS